MNFIKKIIGGFFSFLFGLFKGAKKSEYFLELDDAKGVKVESKPAQVEPAKPAPVATQTTSAANGTQSAPVPAVAIAPVAVDVAAPSEPTPAPQPATIASKPADITTFAPDFLLSPSSNNGRRRPGPSLNPFLTMAKQVKTF